ncbi:uncharacterized protein LOC132933686, partial [Metopolophium dirhodum]|uniref:uncharacterized protein LOC132933686 n=1 Tax=Metopolophium dirhodum TaxID=44670 RepID=UPI00298FB056
NITFNGAVQTLHLGTAPAVAAASPPAETAVAASHPPPRKAPKRRCCRCNHNGHTERQCLAPQTPRRTPAIERGGGSSSIRIRPSRSLSARSRTRTQTPAPRPIGTSTPIASTVSNIFNPNSAK